VSCFMRINEFFGQRVLKLPGARLSIRSEVEIESAAAAAETRIA